MLRMIVTPREILYFPRWIKKLDAYAFQKKKKKPSVGVELRAGGDPHRSEKLRWSTGDMRQWPKQKKNA